MLEDLVFWNAFLTTKFQSSVGNSFRGARDTNRCLAKYAKSFDPVEEVQEPAKITHESSRNQGLACYFGTMSRTSG